MLRYEAFVTYETNALCLSITETNKKIVANGGNEL